MNVLDADRRKLYFRSTYRGMKEMDIIFTRFAEAVLPTLAAGELADYQRILDLPDDQLYYWAVGDENPPAEMMSPLLQKFLSLDYM